MQVTVAGRMYTWRDFWGDASWARARIICTNRRKSTPPSGVSRGPVDKGLALDWEDGTLQRPFQVSSYDELAKTCGARYTDGLVFNPTKDP